MMWASRRSLHFFAKAITKQARPPSNMAVERYGIGSSFWRPDILTESCCSSPKPGNAEQISCSKWEHIYSRIFPFH